MRKSVLKRTLSIVIACILMMSIFAAIPMEAGAVRYLNTMKFTLPSTGYYAEGYAPTYDYAIRDTGLNRHLKKGTDFTVKYTDSYKVGGSCKATFTGAGQYAGSKWCRFTVKKRPLSKCTVKLPKYYTAGIYAGKVYDGVSIYLYDGNDKMRVLTRGSDYTVTYKYSGGKVDLTITGINNYTGTIKQTVSVK